MSERIVAAAIREGACVFTGPHHSAIIQHVSRCARIRPVKGEQGFMTDAGRFVGRREALEVALTAQQVSPALALRPVRTLLSEDLWLIPEAEQELEEQRALAARLTAERDTARAAANLGEELSTWAATVKWSDSEHNTAEWLAGLRTRIEAVQAAWPPQGGPV